MPVRAEHLTSPLEAPRELPSAHGISLARGEAAQHLLPPSVLSGSRASRGAPVCTLGPVPHC